VNESPEKTLNDYLPKLVTDDIVAATQTARTKAAGLLNDQGISAMALLLSNLIAETLEHPERLLERTS
jgi:hypothetical protein